MRLQKDLSVDGPGPQELPVHMSKRGRTTLSRPGTAPREVHIACLVVDIFQATKKDVSDCRQESGIT